MIKSYESTRNSEIKSSASGAILRGIADDGGLYIMRDLDKIKINISDLHGKNYIQMAETVLGLLLDDFPEETIKRCVECAYIHKFDDDEVAPVAKVGGDFVTELFHGPTSAFKDVALSILPHLMTASYEMNDVNGEVIILTATSGDTGKAALEGFKDVEGTKIIVFYPDGGVSQVQKYQMATQEGNNTYVSAIKGNFDDAQTGVKKIFTDEKLSEAIAENNKMFSSANSINIGRLVPQIVYYFSSYMALVDRREISMGDKVNFSVPTGNFGNILAGYFAKLMGLPINKLICASNENNVLYDFIKTGIYDRNREFYKTTSPSMDILVSSNLERLLYVLSGKNNEHVKALMSELNKGGRYEINEKMKERLNDEFYGGYADKDKVNDTIRKVYDKSGYLLDTHTSVAYRVLQDYKDETGDETVSIVLSTASPFKFSKSVYEALFGESDKEEFELMKELSLKTGVKIPSNLQGLKNKEIRHNNICEINEMKDFVVSIAGIKQNI